MRRFKVLLAFTLLAPSAIASVQAQSLRVSPVTVELPAGAESVAFTLETDGNELGVQARVFRWSQSGGEDKLEKTEDVVVSPPVLKVHRGTSSTLRLVRITKTPVSGEETYRVLIDEIPDRKKLQAGTVAFNIRQSVPVFFAGVDARPGAITWKAVMHGSKLAVEATNGGQKRVPGPDAQRHRRRESRSPEKRLGLCAQGPIEEMGTSARHQRGKNPDRQGRKRCGAD